MKKTSFNHDWQFALENDLTAFNQYGFSKYSGASGAPARNYPHSNWEHVTLPHDWAVRLPKSLDACQFNGGRHHTAYHRDMTEGHTNAGRTDNAGWYRKDFLVDEAMAGKRLFLDFEGIFRDAVLWVNGVYIDRHTSGYTGWCVEITDHVVLGEMNSVALRVDSAQTEGWWYEGAGIYRNVWLYVGEQAAFAPNKTYVNAKVNGEVAVTALLDNAADTEKTGVVSCCIRDAAGQIVAEAQTDVAVPAFAQAAAAMKLQIASPELWSVERPYLYTLEITFGADAEQIAFGVRSVEFDKDQGLLLNGKPVKVRGACCHQDLGGVGTALTDNLIRFKIQRLKDMGVNAYRSAHHEAAPALLKACDELGMLVMDEARMFSTAPEAMRQLTGLVERDRNHPSVFIWSIGNEEFSVQDIPWSRKLAEKMVRTVQALDDRPITYGGNNGENFAGANSAVPVRGVNYIRNGASGWLDEYHIAHPDQPILGTEETSYVLSRGGAVTDLANGLLDSSGLVTMPWASTPKGWVKFSEMRPWFAGSFMWTGFDYRGEPNPFYYNNVSSSFGTIDLCGMEKPPFWYYKAWWTDEPVLKLTPHWNHQPGDTVKLHVFTNCSHVTLYVNGEKAGEQDVARFDAPVFTLPFVPGRVTVEGEYQGQLLRDELVTSGGTAVLKCEEVLPAAGSDDIAIWEVSGYDAEGRFCPMADQLITVCAENGRIIGVGNGDPSDLSYEQQADAEEAVFLKSMITSQGEYIIPARVGNERPRRYDWIEEEPQIPGFEDDVRYVTQRAYHKEPVAEQVLTAVLENAEGMQYVEFERLGGETEVYLNGEKLGSNHTDNRGAANDNNRPLRFYGSFRKGENELKLVSRTFEVDQPPVSGYVKVARLCTPVWQVKLHYGRARVFVRGGQNGEAAVTAELG